MTSGLSHSLDSSTVRDAAGGEGDLDTDADMASRRMGCWRLARNMPVETLKASGTPWRRSAPWQSVIVAIERSFSKVSPDLNTMVSMLKVDCATDAIYSLACQLHLPGQLTLSR